MTLKNEIKENKMDMETESAFKTIATQNTKQTERVLDALSTLTNWMDTAQQEIDNLNNRVVRTEEVAKQIYNNEDRDFYT